MTDIARLGYEIDSSGLVSATKALDQNADAAENASGAAKILEREFDSLSKTVQQTGSALAGNEDRYRAIAQRAMEYAEASRSANLSDRALAEAARDAAAGIDWKAQVMARAGTEQERMAQRAQALQLAESRASAEVEKAARAAQLQELNLRKLLGQIDPTIAKLEKLAEMEERLEKARDLGALSPEVFDQYQAKIDDSRAAMLNAGKASDIMTKSIGGLDLQSVRTQQSIASLARALVTGQWSQAQTSIVSLTTRTGLMGGAFTTAGLVVGGAATALGGFAYLANSSEKDVSRLTNALLVTGNYAGVTVGQIDSLTDSLASLQSVTHGGARNALLAVAQTGKFTGEQFELVATIAARMEASVGQSLDTTIRKFEEIGRDPVSALLKLNEAEHFLTQAHLDRIDALIEEGDEQGAAAEAARIYKDRLDEVASAAESARPHLALLLSDIKQIASAALEGAKNFADFIAATSRQTAKRPWWQQFGPAGGVNFLRDMYNVEPVTPTAVSPVSGSIDSKRESERRSAAEAAERDIQRQIESMYGLDTAVNKLEKSFGALSEARQKELVLSGEYNRLMDQAIAADAKKGAGASNKAARAAESLEKRLRRGSDAIEKYIRQWQTTLDGTGNKVMDDFAKRLDFIQDKVAEFERLKLPADKIREFEQEMTALAESIRDKDLIEYLQDFEFATRGLTAFLDPGADATLRFEEAMVALNKEMASGIITTEAYARRVEALKIQRDAAYHSLTRALKEEGLLLRMNADDQEVWNNLQILGANATAEQKREIEELTRARQRDREAMMDQIEAMDSVRSSGANLLSDLARGESPLKALEDALDRINKRLMDMVAENFMDQLLGKRGDPGGGKFGDWLGNLFGGMFGVDQGAADEAARLSKAATELAASGTTLLGAATALSASAAALAAAGAGSAGGAVTGGMSGGGGWLSMLGAVIGGGREHGGGVFSGRMYQVGERNKPELARIGGKQYLIPGDQGRVEPIRGGGQPSVVIHQTIPVQGRIDRRTASKIAQETVVRGRTSLARGNA